MLWKGSEAWKEGFYEEIKGYYALEGVQSIGRWLKRQNEGSY